MSCHMHGNGSHEVLTIHYYISNLSHLPHPLSRHVVVPNYTEFYMHLTSISNYHVLHYKAKIYQIRHKWPKSVFPWIFFLIHYQFRSQWTSMNFLRSKHGCRAFSSAYYCVGSTTWFMRSFSITRARVIVIWVLQWFQDYADILCIEQIPTTYWD